MKKSNLKKLEHKKTAMWKKCNMIKVQHEKSNNENMHKNSITVQSSMQMDDGLYIG